MTDGNRRRVRVALGLVLIVLGIAVGVLAYLVGRSDDEARGAGTSSTAGPPKGVLMIPGSPATRPGEVRVDGYPVIHTTGAVS